MKRCPNPKCDFKTTDDEMVFCPKCEGQVRLVIVHSSKTSDERSPYTPGVSKTYDTGYDSRSIADSIASAMSAHNAPSIGDASAIGSITSTVHDESKKTVNIQIKELSEAEILHKNRVTYHDACVGFIDNGHISDEDRRQLNAIRESLGLHRDIADYILNDVLKQSIRRRVGLPSTAKTTIEIAKLNIELNNLTSIQNSLGDLSALRATVDNDQLDQIYFQLKAILTPDQYLKDYYSIHEKSYWETYWCHVALIRNEPDKAGESLAALVQWDSYYPYQDQAIIQTIGYLMQDRELEARVAYRYITPGFSPDLEPLRFVLSELLDKDWYELFEVSHSVQFYVDALFKVTYARKREQAETNKAQEIAARMDRELVQKEIAYKKEKFIVEYEIKGGSITEALDYSGATQMEYQEWKRSDVDFNLALEAVNKRIAEKRDKEERLIEEQKSAFLAHYESDKGSIKDALEHSGVEQSQVDKWKGVDPSFRERIADIDARLAKEREEEERVISEKKEQFIAAYKSNKCDIQKACSASELSPELISIWRKTDDAFDNKLKCIKQGWRNEIIFKKVLPCIIIAILLVAIYLIGRPIVEERVASKKKAEAELIEKQKKQEEFNKLYNQVLDDFDVAYAGIDRDVAQLDHFKSSLTNLEGVLNSIKSLENNTPSIPKPQYNTLLTKTLLLCDELKDYFLNNFTTTTDDTSRDLWMSKLKEIDSMKQRLQLSKN